MKYKVGDRVRIKTWEDMKEEFKGTTADDYINCPGAYSFPLNEEKELNEKFPDRIVTIKEVKSNYYKMEKIDKKWSWTDEMIKNKELKKVVKKKYNRFELMDLD